MAKTTGATAVAARQAAPDGALPARRGWTLALAAAALTPPAPELSKEKQDART